MTVTRLGLYGASRGLYGSFAGKVEIIPPVDISARTRLGLYGSTRQPYGDFDGKSPILGGRGGRSKYFLKSVGRMMN